MFRSAGPRRKSGAFSLEVFSTGQTNDIQSNAFKNIGERFMSFDDAVPCEKCGQEAEFATETSPLGSEPGYRIYHCSACKHTTWIAWYMTQQQSSPKK